MNMGESHTIAPVTPQPDLAAIEIYQLLGIDPAPRLKR